LGLCGLEAAINIWPSIGAQGADSLRRIIGNEAVTQLETIAFQARDTLQQLKYSLGIERPTAPWQPAVQVAAPPAQTTPPLPTITAPVPLHGPTVMPWQPPPDIEPMGSLKGEGAWTPYIQNAASQTVAYRTFLQPDRERPYSVVAVVAFDLTHTRLHYVLGTEEPSVPKGPKGPGQIAPEDQVPGILVAAFNGGFKATHGHFGAMSNGIVALPPRNGLATIAIYDDGSVRIGEWGRDIITQTENMVAWRENGPLVIQDGKITQRVYSNLVSDWGGTVDGKIVTWRSGLGISADNKTLYYFAGPNLSMPPLARAMMAVGTSQDILLDINAYWVHFAAISAEADNLVAEPLLPAMKESKDRYLRVSPRDFFYVTASRNTPMN